MKTIIILACVAILAGCSASVGVGEPDHTTTRTTYVGHPVAHTAVTETTTTY